MRAGVVVVLAILLAGCQWMTPTSSGEDPPEVTGLELPALTPTASAARLLVLGDQGTGDDTQRSVATGLVTLHAATPADAVVLLGDNFYPDGVNSTTDPQWDSAFRTAYPADSLDLPFYAVLGNHDYHQDPQAEYDYRDPEERWICRGPAEVLPIRVGGVVVAELFLIDSELIVEGTEQGAGIVAWASRRAQTSTARWKILALHHSPVSRGMHGNDTAVQQAFASDFQKGVLQLVLAGHDHDLELSRVGQVTYLVSGAGARTRPMGTGPEQLWSAAVLGFAELEITEAKLAIRFRDASAKVLFETALN